MVVILIHDFVTKTIYVMTWTYLFDIQTYSSFKIDTEYFFENIR